MSHLRNWMFGQTWICQNQKRQTFIFMFHNAPDVQLTKIRYSNSVKKIFHEIPWKPFYYRFVFFYYLRDCTLWAKF